VRLVPARIRHGRPVQLLLRAVIAAMLLVLRLVPHSDAWQVAAAAGIPRDGGIADLLHEAKSPTPYFAFVICEDIERSARSMYNSLKLERELQDQGIPLFATDEPFNIEGINATTVLVRRVKQGVAEWYRLQLKGKVWDGLKEHSLDGWNLGRPPVGYLGEKHPHPNPIKAAEGRSKTRLATHAVYGPIIGQIYRWRVSEHLGKPTIRARLAADPLTYPPPDPTAGWSLALVDEILSNPKYTGHQVMGRRRRKGGKKIWAPPQEWIWTPEPTHPALVDKAAWDKAQRMGRRHGNVRDPEMPTRRTGRRHKFRSRLYCSICHRRLSGTTIRNNTYYRCPHEPGNPRHYAAYPGHRTVSVREDLMMAAFARFFTERVFGPGRAAMLAATLPASTAAADQRRQQRAAALRKKLAKIDVSERALVTELETPIDPADAAAQALRNRVRARFTELYTERTGIESELATLETAPVDEDDPTLLDELPALGDILTGAPAALTERLLAAFDIKATYNRDKHQVTIHATITDTTPQAVTDLLTDPLRRPQQAASISPPTPRSCCPFDRAHWVVPPGQYSESRAEGPASGRCADEVPPRGREARRAAPGARPPGLTRPGRCGSSGRRPTRAAGDRPARRPLAPARR
jgi:site-specific DNA recombinase